MEDIKQYVKKKYPDREIEVVRGYNEMSFAPHITIREGGREININAELYYDSKASFKESIVIDVRNMIFEEIDNFLMRL